MLNIIDVPGYFDFIGEMVGPLRVVETACIVVSGVTGFNVGAEKAFKHAVKSGVGRMFVINQMDREHANFDKVDAAAAGPPWQLCGARAHAHWRRPGFPRRGQCLGKESL